MARRAEPGRPAKAAPRPERVAAFRLGLSAESRAAMFLVAKAYRIVARRWKTPFGEIDIVARRRRTLVFVEVKARANLDDAVEAMTDRGKSGIVGAAEFWLAQHPMTLTPKSASTSSWWHPAKYRAILPMPSMAAVKAWPLRPKLRRHPQWP